MYRLLDLLPFLPDLCHACGVCGVCVVSHYANQDSALRTPRGIHTWIWLDSICTAYEAVLKMDMDNMEIDRCGNQ
jgi:hypothetical protein